MKVKFQEMQNFASENGYLVAVYELVDSVYYLISDDNNIDGVIDYEWDICSKSPSDKQVDFKQAYCSFGHTDYKLILHNTYCLPTTC
jgi:hypothetical protein